MADPTPTERLDRHALVMALWSPSALVAAALLHRGIVMTDNPWWIAAGFAVIVAAFIGHILVNAILGTEFTTGETALAMVVFAIALVALVLTALIGPPALGARIVLPVGAGLAGLVLTVVVYLVIAFGPRSAFGKFDVIRDNNLRAASWLPHRGGRR